MAAGLAVAGGVAHGANTAPATTTSSAAAPARPAAPARFAQPGVLNSRARLDFVRSKVRAGDEPWKSAYARMAESPYASLSRRPKPARSSSAAAVPAQRTATSWPGRH
ncbi:hypothetical protein [Streptomyces sp. NPDC005209]|uniref:hypothetical protein n=1 Tax=Streptomyces sp. NPDC005209 TaxID=3156715 RepID=UPI0033B76FD0